jgi:ribosome-associated translation inhibitor RaiA
MKIQVNSDKTIAVDARLARFVEGEAERLLSRFAAKLTRAEIHLSDVDNKKTGQADKRCLVEVRPAGSQPLSADAKATELAAAVTQALGKMQRSLTTFFGRKGRPAVEVAAPVAAKKKTVAKKVAVKKAAVKKVAVKKAAPKKTVPATAAPEKLSPRGPKKKGIYQARRKSWPAR